jgi:Molybdopterin biosynthesis enzyme
MKNIPTRDAVGHVLCHDLTRIVKGVSKDAAFRKGHVVAAEDIPLLLAMGKDTLFVWDLGDDMLHENDAADILCRLCRNENMSASPVKEGKIELRAEIDGLFLVDAGRLLELNQLDHISIATRHGGFPVRRGDKLAAFRIIPLAIAKDKMRAAEAVAGDEPILKLLPYRPMRIGLVTTGNEIYHKRIVDTFGPVVADKVAQFGSSVVRQILSDDDKDNIAKAIRELLADGMDMILCTGGMSVDPDDRTPAAITAVADEVVSYGTPVLPGAMFMLAYKGDVPVAGLPGCVMYERKTIFDIVFPRLAAGLRVTREELRGLGHGGLCLGCQPCHFPECGFGKGYAMGGFA